MEQTITIADYTEGEDVIYHSRPFAAFSLLDGTKSVGDDYITEAGAATFKYTGGADKKIKFVDVNGDVSYFGNYITIRDVDSDTVEATEKVKILDAAKRTKAIEIVGNTLDNTIISGKGDTTLTGGEGSDLFVYSAGNDLITDYTTDDKISLGAAVSSSYISGAAVIITKTSALVNITASAGNDTIVS